MSYPYSSPAPDSPPLTGSLQPLEWVPTAPPPQRGLIAGSVTGGVVILVVLSLLLIYSRKKRRTDGFNLPVDDNGPPPPRPIDEPYDGQPEHNASLPAYASRSPHSPAPPPPPPPPPPQSPGIGLGFATRIFTYEELEMATGGFSETNILGQGGFGYVHKGVLTDEKEVAIKSLKTDSKQGDPEFKTEVEIISRVHHKNLVSLVGYCISGSQRMLVYEFVPNKTLEFHLHEKGRPVMDWSTRLKIALGAAKGLAYLHEDCSRKIIHRDIKAANILLDSKFEAKVADFGLAKLFSDADTHVSTRIMGTFGYMAPEYAASGRLTEKSDIFSFGVMLLELITGRPPVSPDGSLVDWARPFLTRALEDSNYNTLVDSRLQDYNPTEMARMVACAAACVYHSAQKRPFMSKIIRALEGDMSLSNLNDKSQFNEDMKKFQKLAFASQECGSSEYGGSTSEYGLHPSGPSSTEGQQTSEEMEMGRMKKDSRGFSGST